MSEPHTFFNPESEEELEANEGGHLTPDYRSLDDQERQQQEEEAAKKDEADLDAHPER